MSEPEKKVLTISEKKILVVDDEPSLRKALSIRLKKEGYTVLEAADGKIGTEKALQEHPDLILLDLVMPNLDGLGMVEELQKDSWGKQASIIFLTNVSDPVKIAEIGEGTNSFSTVYDYLVKSNWNIEDVVKKINDRLNFHVSADGK